VGTSVFSPEKNEGREALSFSPLETRPVQYDREFQDSRHLENENGWQ
jgi:hypothetical protein